MNDFQILSKLGEGAYSVVYKVKRLVDGEIYALKKVKLLNLSEKEKLNALNEVRILASVKSNFVISYKEAFFDEKDSTLGIVMEYADKGDLYQRIVEHKKAAMFLEETEIWRIFLQLVKGLKALHDLKILHRDLKSANVFIFADGSAKLGDLNVSKVARRGLGYTQTGTPYYASPEVWKDQPYDNKSDIWSLGCVLYEMITLRPPFRAENMEGLFNKVIKGQFNKIPERFSSDLFNVVKLLLQVAPDARPSCGKILKHPIIQKRIEYFKAYSNGDDTNEDNALLQTIKIPKNLLFLSDKLPKANYDKSDEGNGSSNHTGSNRAYRSFTKNQKDLNEVEITVRVPKKNDNSNNTSNNSGNSSNDNSNNNSNNDNLNNILKQVPPKINNPNTNIIAINSKRFNHHINNNNKHKSNSMDAISLRERNPKQRILLQNELRKISNNEINNALNNLKNPNLKHRINDMAKYVDLPKLNIISHNRIELSKNNAKIIRIGPGYNQNNNNGINHLYKIYAPYLQNGNNNNSVNSVLRAKRYVSPDRRGIGNSNSLAYLNNLEKYYENYNVYKRKAAINNNNNSNSKRGNDISCGSVRSALGMGIGNSGNGGIEYKNIEKLSKRKLSPLRRNIIIGNNNNNIGG